MVGYIKRDTGDNDDDAKVFNDFCTAERKLSPCRNGDDLQTATVSLHLKQRREMEAPPREDSINIF